MLDETSAKDASALEIVVVGGGLCGLLTALLLAKDGHSVRVIERDPDPPPATPEAAWGDWSRRSVRQFHLGHVFLPRFRSELDRELPEVVTALRAVGALEVNPIGVAPESITGGWREGDERFGLLTARRPVVEAVVARVAAGADRVAVMRGEAVTQLLMAPGGVHVAGVVTDSGSEYRADVVIDAAGRNSPVPRLLVEAGAACPVDESEDSGFVYYAVSLRSDDGSMPSGLGSGLHHFESVSTLTLPADNGAWAAGFVAASSDKVMRRLRDPETFERTWLAYPWVAHWLGGRHVDDVAMMAGLEDRVRSYIVDGSPVCTGLVAIGDAWACTNPSLGRGATIGLLQAVALRDHLRQADVGKRESFVRTWHERRDRSVLPWYEDTLVADRHRLQQIESEIAGTTYTATDPRAELYDKLTLVHMADPLLFRAYFDIFYLFQTKEEVFADRVFVAHLMDVFNEHEAAWQRPCPSRGELLDLVSG